MFQRQSLVVSGHDWCTEKCGIYPSVYICNWFDHFVLINSKLCCCSSFGWSAFEIGELNSVETSVCYEVARLEIHHLRVICMPVRYLLNSLSPYTSHKLLKTACIIRKFTHIQNDLKEMKEQN